MPKRSFVTRLRIWLASKLDPWTLQITHGQYRNQMEALTKHFTLERDAHLRIMNGYQSGITKANTYTEVLYAKAYLHMSEVEQAAWREELGQPNIAVASTMPLPGYAFDSN